jgi:hypothetical protein
MRCFLFILFILVGVCNPVFSQDKTTGASASSISAGKKYPVVNTYLGNSTLKNGNITIKKFDSLIHQGLKAKDDAGVKYTLLNFNFTFGERNLYEDSVGELKIMTDYQLVKCFGDSIMTTVLLDVKERLKVGDTLYFDKVLVNRPDNTTTYSKSMKFAIVK